MSDDSSLMCCCMCSLVEILCLIEEKFGLVCLQLPHDLHATENLMFNLPVNFLYFLLNWVNLLDISTSCEKLRAFERNQNLENSCLMSWRPIV